MSTSTVTPAITLSQGERVIALSEDEKAIVLRGTLPEPMAARFRRLGLHIHTQGTTRVDLTIRSTQRTIRTQLWITNHRNAELMAARARARC